MQFGTHSQKKSGDPKGRPARKDTRKPSVGILTTGRAVRQSWGIVAAMAVSVINRCQTLKGPAPLDSGQHQNQNQYPDREHRYGDCKEASENEFILTPLGRGT